MAKIEIPDDFCEPLADFIELYFFQNIRDDESVDNIEYVHKLIHAIEELKRIAKEK